VAAEEAEQPPRHGFKKGHHGRSIPRMKRIYSSRNLSHCDMVKSVLAQSGINSMLKNEFACSTAGAGITGALGFVWPEVWVTDEDEQTAVECLKDSGLSFLEQNG